MRVDVMNLIPILRKCPGLKFQSSGDLLIKMAADESSLLFEMLDGTRITDEKIDHAVAELVLNWA